MTDVTMVTRVRDNRWRFGRIGLVPACIGAVVLGLCVEGAARLAYAHKVRLAAFAPAMFSTLHEYQEQDPDNPATWRLRAGFVKTFGQAMSREGRGTHGADEAFIRINSDGFRGPEISPSHRGQRILTIGDSCTFGTIEASSYPRVLERELRTRVGPDVEVVNAGVEGYSPRDVLAQMRRYKALRPTLVTVYIGWGALFDAPPATSAGQAPVRLASVRLARRLFPHVGAAAREPGAAPGTVPPIPPAKHADPAAREVAALGTFVPSFMGEVEEIVREFRSLGSAVFLVTLPGLYTSDAPLTERALRIGNLPAFTNNPYVLAKLAERYNSALRTLAARDGLHVVDLDAWSRTALQPRDAYFQNAVHMTERGQEMVGAYMAGELETMLNATDRGQDR